MNGAGNVTSTQYQFPQHLTRDIFTAVGTFFFFSFCFSLVISLTYTRVTVCWEKCMIPVIQCELNYTHAGTETTFTHTI